MTFDFESRCRINFSKRSPLPHSKTVAWFYYLALYQSDGTIMSLRVAGEPAHVRADPQQHGKQEAGWQTEHGHHELSVVFQPLDQTVLERVW